MNRGTVEENVACRPPKVAVLVLNWNGRQVLGDCLRSTFALHYPNLEVIVVDNDSKDDSVKMVRELFPQCLLFQNQANLGFAAGNNSGIRLALDRGNDYVLILNNDTVIDENSLSALVERAESDRAIAAVHPKIYFSQPEDHIWFGGGRFSYWKGRNAIIGYKHQDCSVCNVPKEMGFLSGCALLVSRDAWQKVGGFDESLFFASEDVDWCLRARQAGYKLFYEPRAVIWHRESFTILQNNGNAGKMYYYTRNPLVVMWKHGRWWHWLTFLPYHIALSCKRMLLAIRERDWTCVRSIVKAFIDFPAAARRAATQQHSDPLVVDSCSRSQQPDQHKRLTPRSTQ